MQNNNYQRQQRVSTDRFGRAFVLKFAKQVVSKKSGEIVGNAYATYVDLGGKTYKVEVSKADKTIETRNGELGGLWVKVTKVEPLKRNSSI